MFFAEQGCDEKQLSLDGELDGGHMETRRQMKGAVHTFRCLGGTAMKGSPVVYCDGSNWNDSIPTCLSKCADQSLQCYACSGSVVLEVKAVLARNFPAGEVMLSFFVFN